MAIMLALLSSLMWGTADFAGGLMSRTLSAYAVVGVSQAAGFLAVTAAALATGGFGGPVDWLGWAILAGLSGTVGLVAFYAALAAGTMGVVSPIAALGALVPVAVGVALGERPSALAITGIAVALAGAVAASGPETRGAAGPRPVILAAIAGACFGAALTFIALAVMTLWGMRITSVAAFAFAAVALRSLGGVRRQQLVPLVLIGVADAAANLTFALASQRGYVSVTSVVGSLYPVATVLLAWTVLHERLQRIQVMGVIAALAGVALVSLA
jgi:drug/metabolite transporter (DMT)-like permease